MAALRQRWMRVRIFTRHYSLSSRPSKQTFNLLTALCSHLPGQSTGTTYTSRCMATLRKGFAWLG
ncbi:MAG TPA: hypothetical protein DCZ03_00445 [Gammaproteobacteria bacterium]|nr:hypothetical protein [Gammaproteobacteria bacterium]